jgi:signal transduction histidine kinase
LARFENQKQSLKIEKVYLNALLLDILTLYSEKIKTKKIIVKHSFTDDFYINSDAYLVSIIISNIISNAIKYSNDNAEITIDISQVNSLTICSISDKGIGIAQSDLDKIFNPFYRSNATNHPEIKGSGLGLSIVKRITQLLDVKFEIQSEVNKGTTFILSFN